MASTGSPSTEKINRLSLETLIKLIFKKKKKKQNKNLGKKENECIQSCNCIDIGPVSEAGTSSGVCGLVGGLTVRIRQGIAS